ncbi:MAG TPA: protein kinase [Thermoanaerobaculia bacterium]
MSETPRFARLQAAFEEIVELGQEDREEAIRRASGGDHGFAAELRALVAASERVGTPLDAPPLKLLDDAGEEVPGYRILRRIGRGGSSVVYLAEQLGEGFTRRVALKVLDASPNVRLARRFGAEQRILAALEHPGIARLYDAGVAPSGRPYLAMELVEGETLLDHCHSTQAPLRDRLRLFLAVLEAVGYAHASAVVHRDLKPGNILVSARGEPKLLDFGIARLLADAADGEATETTVAPHRAMTPAYASPEQVRGAPVGTRSDIYSLGVVLYELLTGRRPYRLADTSRETLERAIREQEPERPSATVADLPLRRELRGDLDAILLKALRKEPESRYPSAAAFADDLKRYLAGRPVLARRGSLLYRAGKAVRRRRALLANLAFVALLAAGSWGWARWTQQGAAAARPGASPWQAIPVRAAAAESYRRGLAARARFDLAAALRYLRAAAEADAENPLVRAALADVLSLADRAAEAGEEGRQALALAAALPRESRLLVESVALREAGKRAEEAKVLRSLGLLRPDDLEIGLMLARSLIRTGDLAESLQVTTRLRALPPPARDDLRIDLIEADALLDMGRSQESADRADAAAAAAKARGLPSLMGRALLTAAAAHDGLGDTAAIRAHAEQARQLFHARGEVGGLARARYFLCLASLREARHEDVERECGINIRLNEGLGNLGGIARGLNVLAASRRRRGLLPEAREAFAEALAVASSLGDRLNQGRFLHNVANVDQQLGRLPEAEEEFRQAIAARREVEDRRGLALSLESLAEVLMKRGSLSEAEALLVESEATARELKLRELPIVLSTRGDLAALQGDRERALDWYGQAAVLHEKGGERDSVAEIRAFRAELEEPATAATCRRLESAERELRELGDDTGTTVEIWIATCWSEAGAPRRASPWLEKAARESQAAQDSETRLQLGLAQASVALHARDWAAAERRLGETSAECRRLSYGALLLEARLLAARLALTRGDHPERVRTLAEELLRDAQAARFGRIARQAGEILAHPRLARS